MQTFGDVTRRARVDHRCSYCDGTIRAGSHYRRWASEDDGRLSAVRAHPDCVSLWNTLNPWADEVPTEPAEFRQRLLRVRRRGAFPLGAHAMTTTLATLRPCCQTCGAVILNAYQAVYLWVRDNPHDVGRQIVVCAACNAEHFGGARVRP